MIVRGAVVGLALALVTVAGAPAGTPPALERLFPREADVLVPGAGLARLPLPAEVLVACAPDLADLRLFDPAGREVPFLLDGGVAPGAALAEERTIEAAVLDLRREELRPDDRRPLRREVYRLALPEPVVAAGAWALVFEGRPARFVRSVRIAGEGADGATVDLVPRASVVQLGERLADRTSIPLPRFDGVALEVTIEGEEDTWLEPRMHYESTRVLAAGSVLELPLAVTRREVAGGRTVVEITRPPGVVPLELRVASTTPAFDRPIAVSDLRRGGGAVRVGEGRLQRVAARTPTERLTLELAVTEGDRLRVEIADGDSPPLDALAFSAVIRQPALVFALPVPAGGGAAGVLRYGGGRAWRPRYDLTALFHAADGDGDAVAARLHEPEQLVPARLTNLRPNPAFDPSPLFAAAMRPGVAVDPRLFRWRRALTVPPTPEGVSRLRLAPEDVARVRSDLADLRVVDGADRQWPYLVGPAALSALRLRAEAPERRERASHHRLALPAAPLSIERLVVEPAAPVLRRPYRVITTGADGRERVLARGDLAQDPRRPAPIVIPLAGARVETLELVVEDGDDAPVAFARVEAQVALPELLVVAPAGPYALLLGHPDAEAPSYEIAGARETVLALPGAPIEAAALADNPAYRDGARLLAGGRPAELLRQVALWATIVVAIVVLGALTWRLVRREGPGPGASPGAG